MRRIPLNPQRWQRGATLLEALIAFLVLSLGMLSATRLQSHFRLEADVARQRSEAVRLGQQELESLRSFATLAAVPGGRSYAGIASGTSAVDGASGHIGNASYVLRRRVDGSALANAKTAAVSVDWTDRRGATQQMVLHSIIASSDPAYSAALELKSGEQFVRGIFGRAPMIPLAAKDLGNGSSVFKPVGSGSLAYVFDNASGLVSGRCSAIGTAMTTQDLNASDLAGCESISGYWLSGVVRFSSAVPPDTADANDTPPALDVALRLIGGPYPAPPTCSSQALKTVSHASPAGLRIVAVPIAATPDSLGLASWSERGERYVAYQCVVYPLASGTWSGRTTLLPSGWTIGNRAGERRVCRYSADLAGSGAIDTNAEHPDTYTAVAGPLANQNFLVVNAAAHCPAAGPISLQGSAADIFVDRGTLQHQP